MYCHTRVYSDLKGLQELRKFALRKIKGLGGYPGSIVYSSTLPVFLSLYNVPDTVEVTQACLFRTAFQVERS